LRALVTELIGRGLRPRIILNDLENAGVDAATLGDLEAELTPLSGSCLCCETQDALLEALRAESQSPYDLVLLETNGTTDTGILLEILAETADLGHLASPYQITIVDAVMFGRRGWMTAIEREQLSTSSHVRVGKRDLVAPARFAEVVQAAQLLAPAARLTDAADLADELALGIAANSGPPPSTLLKPGRPNATLRRIDGQGADHAHTQTHEGGAKHAGHPFLSCQIEIPYPIAQSTFESFLATLSGRALRAKGVVLLREPLGEKRSFQWVAGQGGEISPCQLQDPDQLRPVAVFVGSGLDIAALRVDLAGLVSTVGEARGT